MDNIRWVDEFVWDPNGTYEMARQIAAERQSVTPVHGGTIVNGLIFFDEFATIQPPEDFADQRKRSIVPIPIVFRIGG